MSEIHSCRRRPVLPQQGPFAPYVFVCLCSVLALQLLVFYATRIPLSHRELHDLTTALDRMIPLRPGWVAVYFLTFIPWIVSLFRITGDSKDHGYRFITALMTAQLISGAMFLIYPCTIVRPELTGDGLAVEGLRFLYRVDSPLNLFPSFHVIFSYFCWRGTMGCRHISRAFGRCNALVLVLACLCILFVKQHTAADIPAALAVSELSLQAARLLRLERIPYALERALHKSHPGECTDENNL